MPTATVLADCSSEPRSDGMYVGPGRGHYPAPMPHTLLGRGGVLHSAFAAIGRLAAQALGFGGDEV